jgi:DNA helicase-2/ATP-dependent DNA helicase PcrA
MPWDTDLLDDQRAAAEHVGRHARLLAGPGTGKTLTLTRHLLKLVLEDEVPPDQILALAFTRVNSFDLNRAARDAFAPHAIPAPRISTLHSFSLYQLLRNARLLRSLPQPLRIADDYEEHWIIRSDLGEILDLNDREVRSRLGQLSSDWHDLRLDHPPHQPADPAFMGAWLRHRELYGYTLRAELVWQLKHAMEENPDEFDMGAAIHHVLVDEYQDLNQCDLAVVASIAAMGAEVYCAGDDDQSIYSFRGAFPEGIRRFPQDFVPSTPLTLEVCFRSDRAIIELGQYVAGLDPDRLPKPIRPRDDAEEGEVHLLRFDSQHGEAAGIAMLATHLIQDQGLPPSEILILLRSDHQSRYSAPIAGQLAAQGVPFNVRSEQAGPLDEGSGRHFLSILRLAVNDRDDLAWRTLLHLVRPGNGVGSTTISRVANAAQDERIRFSEMLVRVEQAPDALPRGRFIAEDMAAIRSMLAPLHELPELDAARAEDPNYRDEMLFRLIEGLDPVSRLILPTDAERAAVMNQVARAATNASAITLPQLVAALTSPDDTLDQELESGCVNILTMHRAKGLSSDAVILVAAEEELIPGDAQGEAYNDERRLLYVSLTRARHFLVATFCTTRTGRQMHSGSNPGRPRRHLTPFLRGALNVEDGLAFAHSLQGNG